MANELALRFEPSGSTVTIETKAVGMLAKLAHDLSIAAREVAATISPSEGEVAVELTVRPVGLEVRGVRKGADVDAGALSASDRADIHKKIRDEVLRSTDVRVRLACDAAAARGEASEVEAKGRVEIGRVSAPLRTRVGIARDGDDLRATGRAKLSLGSLGITPPKGPLGAFRVHDEVDVVFDLRFVRQ